MSRRVTLLAAAAAIAAAAPAAAQYNPYPNQPGYNYPVYPGQPYPGQPYPGQAYPYPAQPYGYSNNPVGAIIDQLLGNRYNVSDRQAIGRCASAALSEAQRQYGYGGYNGYNGYGQASARISAITDVQRRSYDLRVTGLIDMGRGRYGNGYGRRGDLSFRCNVDYRGAVTNLRVRPSDVDWNRPY